MKSSLIPPFLRGLFACAALTLSCHGLLFAQQSDRVALIVGNNDYPDDGNFPDLVNCAHDANLIKATLEGLQFKVFFLENASRSQMDDTLSQFENAISKGGTAVFYFAGHGIEFEGKNYLMASNARLQARSRLGEEAMDAETFAAAMMQAGAKSSFLFLDCCREVPKDANWLTRSAKKRGLAELHVDGDIIIAYAAKPGQAALDGADGNSPYAKALSKWLPSGLKHGDMFEKVRLEVHESTGGAQRTWETGSFLSPFFFNSTGSGTPVEIAVAPTPLAPVVKPPVAMTNTVGNRSSEEALKEFQREMKTMLANHPPGENSLRGQRDRLVSLVSAMESVSTDALPKDLQEAYADYVIPFKTQAAILQDVPDNFPWGQADAITPWMQRMNQTNPDLVARIASVPSLEENIKTAGTKVDSIMAKYGIFIPNVDPQVGNAQAASKPQMSQQEILQAFKEEVSQLVKNNPAPAAGSGNTEQMHYLMRLAQQVRRIDTTGLPADLKQAYENFATPLGTIQDVLGELPADLNWDDDQAMFAYGQKLGMENPALAQRLISIGALASEFEAAGTKVDELMAKYGIYVPAQ